MYNYFNKFPIITYNGSLAVNTLAKVKFNDITKSLGSVFYPYTVQNGERPDIIAANYYDDPRYSWVIYLANDIVDPYYDWLLMDEDFKQYVIKKYGSIEKAQRQIVYWEDNWYEDETTLDISGYNALPSYAKKYFKPITGVAGSVISYVRNDVGLAAESNITVEIFVGPTIVELFTIGEYITQRTNGTLSASGFIKGKRDNYIVVQNVLGQFVSTAGSGVGPIVGADSSTTAVDASDSVVINYDIPQNEYAYWTYVTAYDYENQLNEQRRFIRLIDKSFIDQIEKEMSELL